MKAIRRAAAVLLAGAFVASGGAAAEPGGPSEAVFTASRRFQIPYSAADVGPAGIERVKLYVTRDGGATWHFAGEDADGASPFDFQCADDGIYGFRVAARDRVGHEEPAPVPGRKPDLVVVVDSVPPAVRLVSPQPGETVRAGRPFMIRWEADDPNLSPLPISVYYAYPGEDPRWTRIATREANDGSYLWNVPKGDLRDILIKVEAEDLAGNRGEAVLGKGVTVEGGGVVTPAVTGSKEPAAAPRRVNTTTFDIYYEVENVGASGIRNVELWYTVDEGKAWERYGVYESGKSPIRFVAPKNGLYGFAVIAVSRTGQTENPPTAGVKPEMVAFVDATPPRVAIHRPSAGTFLQGEREVEIRWDAYDEYFAERPVSIYLSSDGGKEWSLVAGGIENTGVFTWAVPGMNGDCQIKVEAADLGGNVTSDAVPVTIDAGRFQSRLAEIVSDGSAGLRIGRRDEMGDVIDQVNRISPDENPVKNPLEIKIHATEPVAEPKQPGPPRPVGSEAVQAARNFFEKANLARILGRLDEAEKAYQEALRQNPDYLEALNDLAGLYVVTGRNAEAAAVYQRAMTLAPSDAEICYNLGAVMVRLGRLDEGVRAYEKAVELRPDAVEFWWHLSQTHLAKKDVAAARRCWEIIRVRAGDDSAYRRFAEAALREYGKP
ncbi:MAG: tetratricopeptide repeat protein [Planctomycetota bacterium]